MAHVTSTDTHHTSNTDVETCKTCLRLQDPLPCSTQPLIRNALEPNPQPNIRNKPWRRSFNHLFLCHVGTHVVAQSITFTAGVVLCIVLGRVRVPEIASRAVRFELKLLWFGSFCHLFFQFRAHPAAKVVHSCCKFPRRGVQGYHFLPHRSTLTCQCMYIYPKKPRGSVDILWLDIGVGVAGVSNLWRASVRLRREDGLQIAEGTPRTFIRL